MIYLLYALLSTVLLLQNTLHDYNLTATQLVPLHPNEDLNENLLYNNIHHTHTQTYYSNTIHINLIIATFEL